VQSFCHGLLIPQDADLHRLVRNQTGRWWKISEKLFRALRKILAGAGRERKSVSRRCLYSLYCMLSARARIDKGGPGLSQMTSTVRHSLILSAASP
jgi:hypothetical protein